MAKPKKTSFGEEFEPILLSAWNSSKDHLDEALVMQTRSAIVEIRRYYTFKKQFPSKIKYAVPKNRAGYLAAFGQRHAYLSYIHLKKIEEHQQLEIPNPDSKAELTITVLGAGAALEIYGLCLYYCEHSFRLKRLRLNVIEKVAEWQPTRHVLLQRWVKGKFPKLTIQSVDIDADLTKESTIRLSEYYDHLANTDILMIYNVVNEIDVIYAEKVWKNVNYILKNCDKRVLVLLMEPYAPKAVPRVLWLIENLSNCCSFIHQGFDEEFHFSAPPTEIKLEGTGIGLNDRLFVPVYTGEASNPTFQTSIRRTHVACVKDPNSPISRDEVQRQLQQLRIRRAKSGRFVGRPKKHVEGEQLHFSSYDVTFPS